MTAAPSSPDLRHIAGPFDIIGDVHGCADELEALLGALGHVVRLDGRGEARRATVQAPPGRRAVFVGDLVDRGPRSPDVVRIVMALVESAGALCVPGNHDDKFMRWLAGRPVKVAHGLDLTIAQYEAEPPGLREQTRNFFASLPSHVWLDEGRLVVAHAGIREKMIGQSSPRVRDFCLFGDTSGDPDEFGLPVRYNWALEYRGRTAIAYGHTPVAEPAWLNNTVCIDTGCVFGGKLTALRWPEREIVAAPAIRQYAARQRPFGLPPPRPRLSR